VITVPTLTYKATSRGGAYAHVTVAQSWTCWTHQGVRYRWIGPALWACDRDGRHWWFKVAIGTWLHVQEL
jgi:hypothetical protein